MSHKYTFKNTGNSINPSRQQAAHMHFSSWDNEDKFLYAVDLGTDEILVFEIDNQNAQAIHRVKMTPGDGPRHLSFHPTKALVYSINELSNTITVFKQNKQNGSLTELQRIKLLQGDLDEKQFASAIKISSDGNFLYAAVRGVNMINAYAIGETGQLKLIDSESVAGN